MKNPDSESEDVLKATPSVGAQLIIPVIALMFTVYYFTTIIDSPWTAQVSAFMIGTILVGLCFGFLVRIGIQRAQNRVTLGLSELFTNQDLSNGRASLFAITIGYVVLINWGGFTVTTFFFLLLAFLVLNNGARKRLAVTIAGLMSLGGYGLFILAFDTRFPRGPFENLMEALLTNGN